MRTRLDQTGDGLGGETGTRVRTPRHGGAATFNAGKRRDAPKGGRLGVFSSDGKKVGRHFGPITPRKPIGARLKISADGQRIGVRLFATTRDDGHEKSNGILIIVIVSVKTISHDYTVWRRRCGRIDNSVRLCRVRATQNRKYDLNRRRRPS